MCVCVLAISNGKKYKKKKNTFEYIEKLYPTAIRTEIKDDRLETDDVNGRKITWDVMVFISGPDNQNKKKEKKV